MIRNLNSKVRNTLVIILILLVLLLGVLYNNNNKNTLNSEIESEIQQIKLYEEPSSKEIAEERAKFKDIKKKIGNYYKEVEGIEISGNINDIKYQQQVMDLGINLEVLGEENEEELLEFVKFIDLYENIEKNKEIKKLLAKYENGNLNSKEAEYLIKISQIPDDMPSTSE